jgi:hypothetical protein
MDIVRIMHTSISLGKTQDEDEEGDRGEACEKI